MRRDEVGYVLDARGSVVTEHGQPTRRATHLKAVHTGKRESNPAVTQYPVLSSRRPGAHVLSGGGHN